MSSYNGYPNAETYHMSLLIDNDQNLSNTLRQIARNGRKSECPTCYVADELRETIEYVIYGDSVSPINDNYFIELAVTLMINSVDWRYLAEHALNDYVDNIKYSWQQRRDNPDQWHDHIVFCQKYPGCKWLSPL